MKALIIIGALFLVGISVVIFLAVKANQYASPAPLPTVPISTNGECASNTMAILGNKPGEIYCVIQN
jgi:hypothetical protein